MRNRIFIAPAGLLGFLLAACTTADAPVLTWVGEGVSIEVELTGIRHSTTGELLHGDLRAVGTSGKLKAVDLRCVGIANGSMSSKQTYVSSYIDIIPSGYRANSKGIVEVAVYWAIPGLTQQDSLQSLKSAKIVIAKASEDPCFEFEK
jgi:hypothetical protein